MVTGGVPVGAGGCGTLVGGGGNVGATVDAGRDTSGPGAQAANNQIPETSTTSSTSFLLLLTTLLEPHRNTGGGWNNKHDSNPNKPKHAILLQ